MSHREANLFLNWIQLLQNLFTDHNQQKAEASLREQAIRLTPESLVPLNKPPISPQLPPVDNATDILFYNKYCDWFILLLPYEHT